MINPDITISDLENMCKDTMVEYLGIQFTAIGPDYITASMPVDHRTKQPLGLLHGGVSVVLAETLGSLAANCSVDMKKFHCVGLDINANHIRSAKEGIVVGTTSPIHIGRTTQIWEINIRNEQKQLVCVSRITMAVLAKKS